MKTIIISDLHVGSEVSRRDKILEFLKTLECDVLILNGDCIDSNDRKLKTKDWKILLEIKKLSKRIKIVWGRGNHGNKIEPIIASLMGIEYVPDYIIVDKRQRIYCVHGDKFDGWAQKQLISDFFTGLYYLIQKLDFKDRRISTWLKRKSKEVLKVHKGLEKKAIEYAKNNGYTGICVGHSHFPALIKNEIIYANSGSFCELPCHYLVIDDGKIELKEY